MTARGAGREARGGGAGGGKDREPRAGDGGAGGAGGYEPVIGLEIHVQLDTATKMFCADANAYGAPPNTHVCPVCLGAPGALPVVNDRAVELAVRAALALGCTVHETSVFARKNYFYPDLPKGYQITQYERPLATAGEFSISSSISSSISISSSSSRGGAGDAAGAGGVAPSTSTTPTTKPVAPVRLRRIHLEEDAGRLLHDRLPDRTGIDLNRAGVPLIEIVTEPDLRRPEQARAFLVGLRRTLRYLGVSDCDMEKGSLRVDANVSVRPAGGAEDGADALGTKTEVKNLNSFSAVERALRYEAARQARVLAGGGIVVHETRLWDDAAGEARPMRSKEAARDYRYFPEPDLPPLVLDADRIERVRATLPELPDAREARLIAEHGLPEYDAGVLTADRAIADYFEAVAGHVAAKPAANWVMGDVMAWLNETGQGIDAYPVPPDRLAALIALAEQGTVSSTAASEVLARMVEGDARDPADIVAAEGLAQVGDTARLEAWVDDALAAHPDEADRLRAGETKLIGFFVGAVMRASGGRADPRRVRAMLEDV